MRALGLAHPPGDLGPIPSWVSELGSAFGEDFGGLALETGVSELSRGGAKAATDGESIAFAEARPGRDTVAHELAHVVQHRRDGLQGVHHEAADGTATSAVEQEANALAECALTPTASTPSVDRAWSGSSLHLRLWAFGVGSFDLAGVHASALDEALAEVEEAAAGSGWVCHSVVGHASPDGGDDANRELGLARAASVASHLGLEGELRTRGEADAANADQSTYPYHRAVELVFEVLDTCDGERVVELEAELAELEAEISELEDQARRRLEIGEQVEDDMCGVGFQRSEDQTAGESVLGWFEYMVAELASQHEPDDYGFGCWQGTNHRKAMESEAAALLQRRDELRGTRDTLVRTLEEAP